MEAVWIEEIHTHIPTPTYTNFLTHWGRLAYIYVSKLNIIGSDHGLVPHDDVIKWKHLPRYWPFVRGIHRSPVNSPHKGQWRGSLMFSLICIWINGWVNNREAGDLRRYRAHSDVTPMGQAIYTNDGILLFWPLGTNLNEILIAIHTFSFKRMHLKCRLQNGSHFVLAIVLNQSSSSDVWIWKINFRRIFWLATGKDRELGSVPLKNSNEVQRPMSQWNTKVSSLFQNNYCKMSFKVISPICDPI